MQLIPFYGRSFESNSYLLVGERNAVLIDAGVNTPDVLNALKAHGAKLQYILLTHGHFDHTISVDTLRKQTPAKLVIHAEDAEMLTDAQKSALAIFFGTHDTHIPEDLTVWDGDVISFEDQQIRVIQTPGHSKGSVCYQLGDMLFSGDTLFDGGYGRYDLHGGDGDTLFRSLGRLRKADPALTVYPGHGGSAPLSDALAKLFGTP